MCLILINYHPNLFHNDYLGASQQQERVINREIQRARTSKVVLILFYFIFILIASPKKQTNKQTNRKNVGRDTATAVANYSGPGY